MAFAQVALYRDQATSPSWRDIARVEPGTLGPRIETQITWRFCAWSLIVHGALDAGRCLTKARWRILLVGPAAHHPGEDAAGFDENWGST